MTSRKQMLFSIVSLFLCVKSVIVRSREVFVETSLLGNIKLALKPSKVASIQGPVL